MKRHATPLCVFTLFVFALSAFPQAAQNLQYNHAYSCNKERVIIGRCRHDSDMRGFPPTKPEDDYCQVVYPDRPLRGGLTVETVELRSDVIQKLAACGAFESRKLPQVWGDADTKADPAPPSGKGANTTVSRPATTANGAAVLVEQAAKYFDAREYAKAIEACKKAMAMEPKNERANFYLAVSYDQSEQWENAVKAWNNYIPLVKPSPTQFILLGDAHRYLKHYDEALNAYQKALNLKPDTKKASGVYYWIGTIYNDTKQYDKAIDSLLTSISLDPNYRHSRLALGRAYFLTGRPAEGIASLKEAIRIKPDFAEAHYYLGLCYLIVEKKEKAMEEYKFLQTIDKGWASELLKYINSP